MVKYWKRGGRKKVVDSQTGLPVWVVSGFAIYKGTIANDTGRNHHVRLDDGTTLVNPEMFATLTEAKKVCLAKINEYTKDAKKYNLDTTAFSKAATKVKAMNEF